MATAVTPKTVKLTTTMPDGTRIRQHPLLWLMDHYPGGPINKSELTRSMGVRPQSLYKWLAKCRADRNFPIPALRAAQAARFLGVDPSVLRPDVFPKGSA
jgi:hypothetical protein